MPTRKSRSGPNSDKPNGRSDTIEPVQIDQPTVAPGPSGDAPASSGGAVITSISNKPTGVPFLVPNQQPEKKKIMLSCRFSVLFAAAFLLVYNDPCVEIQVMQVKA